MTDTAVRLLLRVSIKLLTLLALAFIVYTLLSSLDSGTPGRPASSAPLLHAVEDIAEDRAYRIAWGMGNLILVRRSQLTLDSLQKDTQRLLDPDSLQANQPADLPPETRSVQPELFIAFDRGTDLGCPLEWIPPGHHQPPFQPWGGGFRDNCGGSWYDAAGRVFKGQQAGRNLDIPSYRFRDKGLLEIGPNGDNPTPAN